MKPVLELMKHNVSGDYTQWLEKVQKWLGEEELYSQETSVFEMWFSQMGELVKDEVGRRWDNAQFIRNALFNGDPACAIKNKTCIEIAANAFGDAVQGLEATYGSVPLWGSDVHEVEYAHNLLGGTVLKCLAGKTIVNIGGTHTVNEGPVEYPNLNSNYGVAYRQVVDFGAQDSFVVPLGQSGNFLSPGYDDLMGVWKNGDYLDMKRVDYGANKLEISPK
jgi:penicillin amidase